MDKITPDQLEKIVAEVERLSKQNENLERQDVEEILQTLNLSPDLLDEAITRVRRQETLNQEKKRKLRIFLGIIVVLMITLTGTILLHRNYQQRLQNITVYQSRLTFSEDNGDNLQVINRQNNTEIVYRVTLQNAPLGEQLSLSCQWIDPQGNLSHQNVYQTRKIDKQVWTTYCRHLIGNASLSGTWTVEMFLGDRLLSQHNFQVQ
ncbi:DUF3859 domain-containing protein [Crocosphaera sp.]|uniref:DUF3859 domain-containing protein n=1 Tax=Crocosphaera sp. TaxID=2729996 RepID=UPI003F232FB3|nr:DUF3859 domain-containing protein [Crocosphaera sp.]